MERKRPIVNGATFWAFFASKRVGSTGGSAGACTSLWLAFHDDLADPSSPDPAAREKLATLRDQFRQKLDGRAEAELRDWRRNPSATDALTLERLTDPAFACKLQDQLDARRQQHATVLATEPVIICTEALLP